MTAVYIICFILLSVGIVLILNLTPERIAGDFSKTFEKKKSLRDQALIAHGRKRSHMVSVGMKRMKSALEETGKGSQFSVACAAALVLMAAGCVIALAFGNPFLIPVLAAAFSLIPFIYLKRTISIYETHVKEELETALSIITTSYVRSDNIIRSVRENIVYLKPPVKGIFEGFLTEVSVISPDIRKAIVSLREKISNTIFEEWCDTLISCQNDRTLKDTLMPVVSKLTDVRLVNNGLKTMLGEVRREYYMMVMMVLINIPLLFFLNKDWYGALMYTTFGKAVLAICGAVIIFTAIKMVKYTKPIEYKR